MINKCISGKRVFASELLAEDVLIDLWSRNGYSTGNGPIAVYRCDDCGFYHLTSTGNINAKLATYLSGSKLKLDQEANKWIDKLKKR